MTSTPTHIGTCPCGACERWKALTIAQYELLAAATWSLTSAPFLHGDDELWAITAELCDLVRGEKRLGALSSPLIVLPHLPVWVAENEKKLRRGGPLARYRLTVELLRGDLLEVLLSPWRAVVEGSEWDRLVLAAAQGWDLSAEDLLEGVRLATRPSLSLG